jgi:hypothetical protein
MEVMIYKGEWFVWLLVGVSLAVVFLMPKKNLTWTGLFISLRVSGDITWFADVVAATPIDLFDLSKKNTTDLSDAFLFTFVPSSIATVFMNFYEPSKKWLFTVMFILLSSGLEWGLVLVGYMRNLQWETWYGIPVYFLLFFFFFPWLLRILSKRLINHDFSQE